MHPDIAPPTPPEIPAAPHAEPAYVPSHHTLTSPEPAKPHKPRKNREGLKSIISTLSILIIAPLIALFLTAYVFQSYEVDGPSMQSTLQNHDRLIVLKVPRTLARLTGHSYVPHRTDIIIFTKHDAYDLGGTADRQLIKRVVGLPGERVVVKDSVLTVYNKEHPGGFQPDSTFPYGSVIKTTSGDIDLTVPAGQVFVCGDNRENSLDFRTNIGQ
jgi:signal peptidase I